MKLHIFVLSLLLASAKAGTRFDDELREFFEYIRQQMPCGFPAYGIPPLAPYTEDFTQFDFTNRGVDLTGNFTNLSVEGLDGFEIKELTFATMLMKMRFDFHFNQIKIFSQYLARGGLKLLGLPFVITGKGDFDLILQDVRLSGSFKVGPTTSNGLQIYAFSSSLQMNGVQSKTTGIMNSEIFSNIFNQWVEEFFRIIFEDYQSGIDSKIASLIVPSANNALANVSMVELLALILGFGANSVNLPVCQL